MKIKGEVAKLTSAESFAIGKGASPLDIDVNRIDFLGALDRAKKLQKPEDSEWAVPVVSVIASQLLRLPVEVELFPTPQAASIETK